MKRVIRGSTIKSSSRIYSADEEQAEGSEGQGDNDSGFEQLLKRLQAIGNYQSFISTLKNLNADQKKLFMEHFGDVDTVNPQVSDGGINVTALIPTQSEIDWKKSLSRGLSEDCSHYFNSPVELGMPVLTYAGKYIIDGHHRWSQVFMFNPSGQVSCTNFNYEADGPIDVLKDFQAGVLAELGEVKVGTAGTNIWDVDKATLTAYIEENISDACWNSLVNAGVAEDRESAIDYIVNNAMTLQNKVKPISGAPDRVDMPQTTKEVVKRVAHGLSDMSAATKLGLRCPTCGAKSLNNVTREITSATDIEDGDMFVCDECGAAIEATTENGRLKLADIMESSKITCWN